MGFGILFIGYFVAFGSAFITEFYFFGDVVGFLLMAYGAWKLAHYHKSFLATLALSVLSAAVCGMKGYLMVAGGKESALYASLNTYATPLLKGAVCVALLVGIFLLSRAIEMKSIEKRSAVLLCVFVFYIGLYAVNGLCGEAIAEKSVSAANALAAVCVIFDIVWFLALLFHILSCMKWIAPAEQVEAEAKGKDAEGEGLLARLGGKMDELEDKAHKPYDPLDPKNKK